MSRKENAKIAELVNLQQTYLTQIDGQFAEAEGITDAAEKILKLQQLVRDIFRANNDVETKLGLIASGRAGKKAWKVAGIAAVITAAAVTIPAVLVAPPIGLAGIGAILTVGVPAAITHDISLEGKKKQLLKQNPAFGDFVETINAQRTRAGTLLDETVRSCSIDLEGVSNSPWFARALKDCEQLQDLFNAAAVKRAALGDKPAQGTATKPPGTLRL